MLKSLVSYNKKSQVWNTHKVATATKRLVTYFELYKLINHLDGSIIKCGISADEAFSYFSFFKESIGKRRQPMVSFEKNPSVFETIELNNETVTVVKPKRVSAKQIELIKKGREKNIDYLPGQLADSIPAFLIDNPELKIALLTIDLDDYECTLTAMQYLYPRLVAGGVLIINNYHEKNGESLAIQEYFSDTGTFFRHFSLEKGPHYLIKE